MLSSPWCWCDKIVALHGVNNQMFETIHWVPVDFKHLVTPLSPVYSLLMSCWRSGGDCYTRTRSPGRLSHIVRIKAHHNNEYVVISKLDNGESSHKDLGVQWLNQGAWDYNPGWVSCWGWGEGNMLAHPYCLCAVCLEAGNPRTSSGIMV